MKDKTIYQIEQLYPMDSQYKDTNECGKELLIKAIEKIGWRNLPEEFLNQYLNECLIEEGNG